jgi:CRP-like cAMP-binding protein
MSTPEKLKTYLEELFPLPEKDWELFSTLLEKRAYPRKTRILKAGDIENYVSYVAKGIVRYFVEEEEKDITFDIAFEDNLAAAYDSFLTRTPVLYSAEALVDTELWSIHYDDLQRVYAGSAVGDRVGRLAAERLYIRKNKRQLTLLKDSAEQRYLDLLNEHSHFLQSVPLKYLASYIGITPQALSRIRRRVAE